MNEKNVAILMIILGLIALLFPVLSTQTIGVFTGMLVLFVGIGLIIAGIVVLPFNQIIGLLGIIFSFACFIFSFNLMFNPAVVSSLIGLIVYFIGFILIVMGLLAIITSLEPFRLVGINTLVFGILSIVVGIFVHNPAVLGTIIGIWLIISGLLSLFGSKKEYVGGDDFIDV